MPFAIAECRRRSSLRHSMRRSILPHSVWTAFRGSTSGAPVARTLTSMCRTSRRRCHPCCEMRRTCRWCGAILPAHSAQPWLASLRAFQSRMLRRASGPTILTCPGRPGATGEDRAARGDQRRRGAPCRNRDRQHRRRSAAAARPSCAARGDEPPGLPVWRRPGRRPYRSDHRPLARAKVGRAPYCLTVRLDRDSIPPGNCGICGFGHQEVKHAFTR